MEAERGMVRDSCHGVAATKDHRGGARPSQLIASVRWTRWREGAGQTVSRTISRLHVRQDRRARHLAELLVVGGRQRRQACFAGVGVTGSTGSLQFVRAEDRLPLQGGGRRVIRSAVGSEELGALTVSAPGVASRPGRLARGVVGVASRRQGRYANSLFTGQRAKARRGK